MLNENLYKSQLQLLGIEPSYQRIKLFEYLKNNTMHPTADEIYNDLKPLVPTLSKTTIYNTLKLFTKKGILNEILIEGNELRYDPHINPHAHFKCKKCNSLIDLNIEKESLTNVLIDFEIEEMHLYFKGICLNCKK